MLHPVGLIATVELPGSLCSNEVQTQGFSSQFCTETFKPPPNPYLDQTKEKLGLKLLLDSHSLALI